MKGCFLKKRMSGQSRGEYQAAWTQIQTRRTNTMYRYPKETAPWRTPRRPRLKVAPLPLSSFFLSPSRFLFRQEQARNPK
jgi:hypothetical protein